MNKNYLFYDRLKKAIKDSGKSVNCVERELGYTRNALQNYKNGREPSGGRLVELAQYFQVSPEYLIGKTDVVLTISLEDCFKDLSEDQKIEILKISQNWLYSKIIQKKITYK